MKTRRTTRAEQGKHLRCRRYDGRRWRCSATAMTGRSLCEKHYLQVCRRRRRRSHDNKTENLSKRNDKDPRKNETQKFKCESEENVVRLSSDENSGDECTPILKLPKIVANSERLNSLTRMTLALLLQTLTRREFIKNIVAVQVERCKQDCGATWKVVECNPYVVGGAEHPDMYTSFLNHLCSLAEEDPGIIDEVFSVVEKGSTGEDDRVQYLFKCCTSLNGGGGSFQAPAVFEPTGCVYVAGYSRQLPSPEEYWQGGLRMCVHLTMSQFVREEDYLCVLEASALPVAHLLPAQ